MVRHRGMAVALVFAILAGTGGAADWPHFLGPAQDLSTREANLDFSFTPDGPRLLWEVERGTGHAGPVVAGGRVVFLHGLEKEEEVVCLRAEDGEELWRHRYPVEVSVHFGVVDTPKSSPVIDPETGLVYTLGNDGDLLCLRLEDGAVVWQLQLPGVFGPAPSFFGYGSCPLIYRDKLIVQAGGVQGGVVALDKKSGEVVWTSPHKWHGSYASPVVGQVNGQDRIFAFVGGKTDPPAGGLLCVNPEDGTIDSAFPWRSENFTSTIGASPVPCGPNQVFITEDFGKGGVLVEYDDQFQPRARWRRAEFGCRLQTPLYHEGTLYGFGGSGGLMMGVDVDTGRVFWSEAFYLTTIPWQGREVPISLGHAHFVRTPEGFLCLSENGALLWMQLGRGGYQILSRAHLFFAPETWSPPVISDGRLFVVQNEMGSRLLCYDVSGGSADSPGEKGGVFPEGQ